MIGFDERKKEGPFFVKDQGVDMMPFSEETFEPRHDHFSIMFDGFKERGLPA